MGQPGIVESKFAASREIDSGIRSRYSHKVVDDSADAGLASQSLPHAGVSRGRLQSCSWRTRGGRSSEQAIERVPKRLGSFVRVWTPFRIRQAGIDLANDFLIGCEVGPEGPQGTLE
jgi:hypothetical protein